MKNIHIRSMLLALCLLTPAYGQLSNGYVFIAPGAESQYGRDTSYFHGGVGGEWISRFYVGGGGEVGVVTGREFGGTFGLFTGFVSLHIPTGQRKWDPFVTLGPAYATNGSSGDLFAALGGGVNYWWQPRLGIRFEVKTYQRAFEGSLTDFRIGLSFR